MSAADLAPTQIPKGVKISDIVRTTPQDPRNPNVNQNKHCYGKYNEFFRCEKFKGQGHADCLSLKQDYHTMCPLEWIEKWDAQREAGNFPGPL